ncbi:MAG: zinc ribbon domain-containing protein [Thermoplasmata archaeon]|nr:MAG: zinc ribbon domain-containing protein [Thermoplasmata archaeon]
MDINELFNGLKKSRWVWLIYIPLTIPVDLFLAFYGGCFAPIIVALATFGIPYFFGVKSMRTFFIAGTVIILITGILFGALYTYFMFNQSYIFEEKMLSGPELQDGTVSPYIGEENTSFNFTVRYTGTESPSNITVFVNITGVIEKYEEGFPLDNYNGLFYKEIILDKDIYFYNFTVHTNTTNTWSATKDVAFGPVTVPYSEMLSTQIVQSLLLWFINSGLIFYMTLVLYWWAKKSKEERMKFGEGSEDEKEEKAKEQKDETLEDEDEFEEDFKEEAEEEDVKEAAGKGEYSCTSCGADVSEDDTECPHCGEEFEGFEEDERKAEEEPKEEKEKVEAVVSESEGEYSCTECGADVSEDDIKCPNCGEDFEGFEEDESKAEEEKPKEKKVEVEAVIPEGKGEYTCTECGADVSEDDIKCPNCGEDFEGYEGEEEEGD